MKKFITLMTTALLLCSCGERTDEKIVRLLDEGTARLESAKTEQEAAEIEQSVLDSLQTLGDEASIIDNLRFGDKEQERVSEATTRFTSAALKKISELAK